MKSNSSNNRFAETVDKCMDAAVGKMDRRKKTPKRWYWNRRKTLELQIAEIQAQRQLSPEEFSKWLSERAKRNSRELDRKQNAA